MLLKTAPLNSARNFVPGERAKTPPGGCSIDPDWFCDRNKTFGSPNGGMFTVAIFLNFQVVLATSAPRRLRKVPAAIPIRVLDNFRSFSEAGGYV